MTYLLETAPCGFNKGGDLGDASPPIKKPFLAFGEKGIKRAVALLIPDGIGATPND